MDIHIHGKPALIPPSLGPVQKGGGRDKIGGIPPVLSPALPFPLFFVPPLPPSSPYIQLGDMGDRCNKLSSPSVRIPGDLGQSPSGNRIWCILALTSGIRMIRWHQFY